jgi:ATP-dependent Clp protease protease subunit
MTKKTWYAIKAAAEGGDTAEVHILDQIGYWGVNAKEFLTEFRALKAPNVKLYINSPGGSVFEALAIFNGMRNSGRRIEVHVLGIAASAASYIAMAGDKIVMPANTMMFVHNPINAVYGNAEEMREMADILDKIGASLTATYAKRFKGEEKALTELLAAESYLTAAECLEYGFCDEVTEEITATASFDVESLPEAARKVFEAAKVPPVEPPAPAAPSEALADQVAAYAKSRGLEGYTAVFVSAPGADNYEAACKLVDAAFQIAALAKHAGLPGQAEALIRGRKSVDEARASLADALADADVTTTVNTTQKSPKNAATGAADPEYSPTAMWDARRALKQ